LITGAASGLGRQLAFKYASRGAKLALTDIQEDRLLETAKECKELGADTVIS